MKRAHPVLASDAGRFSLENGYLVLEESKSKLCARRSEAGKFHAPFLIGCFDQAGMLLTVPAPLFVPLIMRPLRIRDHLWILNTLLAGCMLGCQSVPPVNEGYPHQQTLRGTSRAQVLACAGTPLQEREDGAVTLLRYYKEAPLLEESMVSSKSSLPTVHHGCWATVVLKDQRVDQVRYRFVPSSVDASNDCEAIFANCPK